MSTEFGENFDDVLFHFLSFRKRNEEVTKNRNGIEVNKRNRCGYRFDGGGGKTKESKMYVFFRFEVKIMGTDESFSMINLNLSLIHI